MKFLFLTLLFLSLCLFANSQAKSFNYPDPVKAIGKGEFQKDTVIKTVSYKIYKGAKGGRYIVAQNTKGEYIRRYIKRD